MKQSNCSPKEKEEISELTLKDKILFSEKIKSMKTEILCEVVSMIYTYMPTALEDIGEQIHIRVDLLNRGTYDKIIA